MTVKESIRRWLDHLRPSSAGAANLPVTRESVVRAFLAELGRLPESEAVIEAHLRLANQSVLESVLRESEEYGVRSAARAGASPGSSASTVPGRRLVLYGNCQMAPLAQLMQAMTGWPMPEVVPATSATMARLLAGDERVLEPVQRSDLVLVQNMQDVVRRIEEILPDHAHKIRRVPSISFSGFHPDIVYLIDKASGRPLKGAMSEYQSALAVAACMQGLSIDEAVDLFRQDVYEELGYFEHWTHSRRSLEDSFDWAGLPLGESLGRWNPTGCWMYSVNHPKPNVLADLARRLLQREDLAALPGAEEFVQDSLALDAVWPVYPEIARALGVGGSLQFKQPLDPAQAQFPVQTISLRDMVVHTFASLHGRGPGDFTCERLESPRFANLRRFVGRPPAPVTPAAGIATVGAGQPAGSGANPYRGLPDHQFWRRAVELCPVSELDPVLQTRFRLQRSDRVATAGSCFAQHISATLRGQGFRFLVTEDAPELSPQEAMRRQFGIFSARYGNLYTARQLLQLFQRAFGSFAPADRHWQRADGRWVDPLRPQVEPDGYDSPEAVLGAAELHLRAVREMFESLDVLVFTLGLTEAWRSKADGTVYPLAPGVAAGAMDPALHEFVNFGVDDVVRDLSELIVMLRGVNPAARVILTVSPVPLIATFVPRHVLVSNTLSKATLRVAADQVAARMPDVDYFPSFEIITGAPTRMAYFEPDLRSVTPAGVGHVMRLFLKHYASGHVLPDAEFDREAARNAEIFCDEEALDRR